MLKRLSIKTKAAFTTIIFMGILTAVIAAIGYKLYHDSVMERFTAYTDTVLEYACRTAVKYSFGDMIAERKMPEEYEELRLELNEVKDSSDIEYLYAIYFEDIEDIHSLHYAINAKNREELSAGKPLSEIYTYMGKPCEEGSFADDTLITLQKAVVSKKRTNGILDGYSDVYGHMLNGYRVIYDSRDHAAGLLCIEIDINRINQDVHRYVRIVIVIAAVFTAIVISIYLLNTEHYLIGPIINIAESSNSFVNKMKDDVEPEKLVYEKVPVRTGGEIRLLAENVESLANGVASYMTNLKAATSERERISTELSLATRIQAAMLPDTFPAFPEHPEFDIYASMDPAKEVGGDFYDFFLIDETHLGLVMADVSGKGVPAALFMMVSKILVQNYAMTDRSPAEVLRAVNDQICANNREEMFVTVWFGILDTDTGKITAANAGHEYPVVMQGGGRFEIFKDQHGFVIGTLGGAKYKDYELLLAPGSKLFLYTDGVPEATDAHDEMFGTERLLEALNMDAEAAPEQALKNVRGAVDGFVGEAEQFDDLTMLCIEYRGKKD